MLTDGGTVRGTCVLVTPTGPTTLTSSSRASGACLLRVSTATLRRAPATAPTKSPPPILAARYLEGVREKPNTIAVGTMHITAARQASPGGP